MSAIQKIAYFQNRRDEIPNQLLAKELAQTQDREGIREIAENLRNDNQNIQSDCLKVLYEIGYINPKLIAEYANIFLKLLKSKNNRLVWGSMIALSTITDLTVDEIYPHYSEIQHTMEKGSVITIDNGIKVLASIAANDRYRQELFPYLLKHLENCRPKDVAQHAEKIVAAVNRDNKRAFINVLEKRTPDLTHAQVSRIKRILRGIE
jgi:hypothetical protein